MLAFRSFAIGLSAAFCALLLMPPTVRVVEVPYVIDSTACAQAMRSSPSPTIVDAAPGITAAQLALTLRLAPGEQIASIDDVAVTSDVSAGILLATKRPHAQRYIDLVVDGPAGKRRILVLLH